MSPKSKKKKESKSQNRTKASTKAAKTKKKSKKNKQLERKRIKFYATAAIILLLFITMSFVFEIETVQTNAMEPNIYKGDSILVLTVPSSLLEYKPGNVVLLSRTDTSPNVLRVIANNKEKLRIKNASLTIDEKIVGHKNVISNALRLDQSQTQEFVETLPNSYTYRIQWPALPLLSTQTRETQLGENEAYLLGDNRFSSYDSRQFGAVSESELRGKVLLVLRAAKENNGIIGSWIKIFD